MDKYIDSSCALNFTSLLIGTSIHDSDVLTLLFLIICFITGLAGNVAVLLIYCKFYKQTNYRVYVIFIAAIDTTFCTTVVPFYVVAIVFRYGFQWDAICRIGCFLAIFLSLASLMVLMIIAIDRYIVVLRPMKSNRGRGLHAAKCCLCVLILCGILSWYSALIYGVKKDNLRERTVSSCTSVHEMATINSYILVSCCALLSSFFVVTYGGIWYKICRHSRRLNATTRKSRTRQTVIIYIVMTAVFSSTTLLTTGLNVLRETAEPSFLCQAGTAGKTLFSFLLVAHCINHVSNPIIYFCRDQKFQDSFRKLFGCGQGVILNGESPTHSSKSYSIKDSISTLKRNDISMDFSSKDFGNTFSRNQNS